MNIQHFRYALEIAKVRSFSIAAENLYMGQPNLSKAIKELENYLGFDIFKRTGKGVFLTQKGDEFLQQAQKILFQLDELETTYRKAPAKKQKFRICVPRSSYISLALTYFLTDLDMGDEININFRETNSMQTIRSIVDEGYHLGIIRYQSIHEEYFLNFLKDRNLSYTAVWDYESVVVVSKDHPLAREKEVSYEELIQYIQIIHGDLSVPYISLKDKKKLAQNTSPRRCVYVYERGSQFDILTHIPTAFMFASPMPPDILERNGLVQLLCSDMQHSSDVLIYPENQHFNSFEQLFIEKLSYVKEEVSKFLPSRS